MAKSDPQPPWGLVLVRAAVGAGLVHAGAREIGRGVGPWLVESAAERVAAAPAPLALYGREVLLRWPDPFAHVLAWGCLALGALLLVGALVRPAGALAAVLALHAAAFGPPHLRALALLAAVCAAACALSRAGRRLGLDRGLDARLPAWATWTRR